MRLMKLICFIKNNCLPNFSKKIFLFNISIQTPRHRPEFQGQKPDRPDIAFQIRCHYCSRLNKFGSFANLQQVKNRAVHRTRCAAAQLHSIHIPQVLAAHKIRLIRQRSNGRVDSGMGMESLANIKCSRSMMMDCESCCRFQHHRRLFHLISNTPCRVECIVVDCDCTRDLLDTHV